MGRTHNKEETFARTADPLGYVQAADVLDVVQSILALQRDHGDQRCANTRGCGACSTARASVVPRYLAEGLLQG